MNIHDFDDIRPYMPEELSDVFASLLSDAEFQNVVVMIGSMLHGIDPSASPSASQQIIDEFSKMMYSSCDNVEFQKNLIYPLLTHILQTASDGLGSNYGSLDNENGKSFTFISNHRDIVLDSALLDYSLINNGYNTVEIAIGDNLLIRPWIKDLVRVNKSFIVQRSLNMREMLLASAKLSKYMHFAINEKHEHLWIAQREGRAKDGNDRTQESVLKMMAMGGKLQDLNIVPLSITYEYDPCDYLKAEEMQHTRDIEGFKKSPADDLENMKTGIFGKKGRIFYRTGRCINEFLDSLPSDMPKTEYFKTVAQHIDEEIYKGYEPLAVHYVALDKHLGGHQYSDHYNDSEEKRFSDYVEGQLSKVKIENPDMDFLRSKIYEMYANPVKNQLKVES